jgi:hypothetical protein
VKIWKMWKAVQVITAGDPSPGQDPGHARESALMEMAQRMGQVMATGVGAAWARERGAALPGTAAAATVPQTADVLAAGIAAIRARDGAFEPATLVTFADEVFVAVSRAWASGDPSIARPVLANSLWDPLVAAHATGMIAARLGQILGAETASGTLVGAHTDERYDTVIVTFTVELPPGIAPPMAPWREDWLLQRSLVPGGNPSALAESCPGCGASAHPDAAGNCEHCHLPIPVLTVGWLATHILSHNPVIEHQTEEMVDEARRNPAMLREMPDAMLLQLPPDTLAQLAPDIAARLRPQQGPGR